MDADAPLYDGTGGRWQMRLSISLHTPDEIEEGLDRLAALVRDTVARP